jgi:hypothetical protein
MFCDCGGGPGTSLIPSPFLDCKLVDTVEPRTAHWCCFCAVPPTCEGVRRYLPDSVKTPGRTARIDRRTGRADRPPFAILGGPRIDGFRRNRSCLCPRTGVRWLDVARGVLLSTADRASRGLGHAIARPVQEAPRPVGPRSGVRDSHARRREHARSPAPRTQVEGGALQVVAVVRSRDAHGSGEASWSIQARR